MARENDSARAYLIFAQGDLTFFFAALLPPQPPGTNVQDDLVNIKVNKLLVALPARRTLLLLLTRAS